MQAGQLSSEKAYPYVGRDNQSCKAPVPGMFVSLSMLKGYYRIPSDENQVKSALMTLGPLLTTMDMDYNGSCRYLGKNEVCKPADGEGPQTLEYNYPLVNHALLLVGWREHVNGDKYWIVKNSWGPKWGDNGIGMISREPYPTAKDYKYGAFNILTDVVSVYTADD